LTLEEPLIDQINYQSKRNSVNNIVVTMATDVLAVHNLVNIYNNGIPSAYIVDPGKEVLYQMIQAQEEKRNEMNRSLAYTYVPEKPKRVIYLHNMPNFHMFWLERIAKEMSHFQRPTGHFDKKLHDKLMKDSQFHLNLDKSHSINRNHTNKMNNHKNRVKYGGKMCFQKPRTTCERRIPIRK